jgi:hypothetical protein
MMDEMRLRMQRRNSAISGKFDKQSQKRDSLIVKNARLAQDNDDNSVPSFAKPHKMKPPPPPHENPNRSSISKTSSTLLQAGIESDWLFFIVTVIVAVVCPRIRSRDSFIPPKAFNQLMKAMAVTMITCQLLDVLPW